jgi:hypothetical protein
MRSSRIAAVALGAVLTAVPAFAQKQQINGAGATFPNPIYSKWFSEYNKLHPEVEINYQSIGSGGGIRQVINQTVFFGATDGPMTDEQLQSAPGKILHFPSVLGGDPVYNIPGVDEELDSPARSRHLPRQDHEVERPGDHQAESRREASGNRHHGLPPVRWVRNDVHLGGLPLQSLSGVEEEGRDRNVGQLAGRNRRQG